MYCLTAISCNRIHYPLGEILSAEKKQSLSSWNDWTWCCRESQSFIKVFIVSAVFNCYCFIDITKAWKHVSKDVDYNKEVMSNSVQGRKIFYPLDYLPLLSTRPMLWAKLGLPRSSSSILGIKARKISSKLSRKWTRK